MKIVGKNMIDKKAVEKACGRIEFADDLCLEPMLYLKVYRSPLSHAEILSIDPSEALRLPGVAGVVTAADIPGENRIGAIVKDQPVLAEERIRFKGEAIAIVGAASPEKADEALGAIRVELREREPVFDPLEAMRTGSILLHGKSNVLMRRRIRKGNVDQGFLESDVTVENTYRTQMVDHAYLEKESGLGFIDEEGSVAVFASTQYAHENQREIAHVLGLDIDRVRVIQVATGGGFGGKIDSLFQCLVAVAAYKFRRPVKLTYSRRESFMTSTKRHPLIIKYRTGAKRDGRIMAVEAEIICDTGAYASLGPGVTSRAAIHASGPYEIPHVKVDSYCVYTNHPVCGAMRGFGVPQVAFAHESQMDILAEKLGLSPFAIRRINFLKKDSVTATGQQLLGSVGIGQTLDEVERCVERDEKRDRDGRRLKGRGLASIFHGVGMTGLANPSEAKVEIGPDGKVSVLTGAADIGQGLETTMAQIAAEVLGVGYEDVTVKSGDTAKTPDSGITAADRQTYCTGNSVRLAAIAAKRKLLEMAADLLEANIEDLETAAGKVFVRGSPGRGVTFARVVSDSPSRTGQKAITGQGSFDPVTIPLDPETGYGVPYATYAFGTQLAEVEVDPQTGVIQAKSFIACHDVGKAINPGNIEGQIAGGISMGLGYALMENYVPGETDSFRKYLIPTALDVPEIKTLIVEDPELTGPFGAKGVGEPATDPTGAAISNAVCNAIGARITELPLTPERVLKALERREKP